MKALDLFCGLGGWSDGLAMEGFEVMGVEIEPKIARLYKHPVIVEDVRNLKGSQFPGYDLIVGSPPCRDFSIIGKTLGHRWKNPPDPQGNGMELVNAFLEIVDRAKPKYWLMENVPELRKYLKMKPKVTSRLGRGMMRCFWGKFPQFLIFRQMDKTISKSKNRLDWCGPEKMKSWERAKIPLPVARALGKAVKQQLA